MSKPVLSQLATVEDDLSQQIERLESQLATIKEQQTGLQTVIEMFQETPAKGTASTARASSTKNAVASSSQAVSRAAATSTAKRKPAARKAGRPSGKSSSVSKTKTSKAKTSKVRTKTAKPLTTKKKKKDGRAADWQKYVQPEYKDAALPEAVSTVLRSHPSEIFKIAGIMSSIFIEDMPREDFLKARNRVSNILSAGARDGTWYRGRNGRYAQTENVTKTR